MTHHPSNPDFDPEVHFRPVPHVDLHTIRLDAWTTQHDLYSARNFIYQKQAEVRDYPNRFIDTAGDQLLDELEAIDGLLNGYAEHLKEGHQLQCPPLDFSTWLCIELNLIPRTNS